MCLNPPKVLACNDRTEQELRSWKNGKHETELQMWYISFEW